MRRVLALLVALLLGLLLAACSAQAEEGVTVTILDIGKADAILVTAGDWAMLIDAGKNKDGEEILSLCEETGVRSLDVMVITHYDKDHVGGADKVLEGLPVKKLYEPGYEKDGKQYKQFREAVAASGVEAEFVREDMEFSLGEATFAVTTPRRDYYGEDEENDLSLVVRMTYGETRFLFAADAENPRLGEMLDGAELQSDFLKVPHHGVWEDRSAAFFRAVGARYAVITSAGDEPESSAVVKALEDCGTEVFLTRHGRVRAVSDGKTVRVEYV